MSKSLVSDALWALVAPLLPVEQPKPQGGRPRIPDRAALTGILFVLKSGIPWEMLPPAVSEAVPDADNPRVVLKVNPNGAKAAF